MKRRSRLLLLVALSLLVFLSGCIGDGSPTGTKSVQNTTPTSAESTSYQTETTPTNTGAPTETATETDTGTSTGSPPASGSVQFDEDGNVLCTADMDEDSGCEANETNEGSGPGFSLPDDVVLNITLQPVLKLMPIKMPNMTYTGPLSSMASVPGEKDTIEWVSVLTSSTDPGKNLAITLHFKNESLMGQYIHPEFLMNPVTGEKVTYKPTVIRIDEGSEFGERWEVHIYGGISKGSFTLYRVTGSGLNELQSGEVSFSGSSASFTIENFSGMFPEKVFLRVHAVPMSETMPAFYYPSEKTFVLIASKGLIEYQESAFFGMEGEPISLRATASGYDLNFDFYLERPDDWLPFAVYIDSTDDGKINWVLKVSENGFQLLDSNGNTFREGDVEIEDTQLGRKVSLKVENLFGLIPWMSFRFWATNWIDRFPAKSNLWLDANDGMLIEKDVDSYLVVVVEDVFIKGNKDKAEGEIQLSSWAYGLSWPQGKLYPVNYSEIYTFGYPVAHWVEAKDNSRLLYHDEMSTGSLGSAFVNGYPILAMPMEEAEKYRIIVLETAGWDRDEPGEYVTKTVGLLTDFAVGMATGEIGTIAEYAYKGATWMNWLATGQSADDFWGSVFEWLAGAEPDRVGDAVYILKPNEADFTNGYRVVTESKDGNMRVTYVIYEVEVPRIIRYDHLKAELLGVSFTKDTEWGDDEYYYYARACSGFVSNGETRGLNGVNVEVAVPGGYAYSYPVRSEEGLTFHRDSCVASKLPHKHLLGNKVNLDPDLVMLDLDDARVPFLYMEYSGWESDSGKWGNDDDPMGNVGITILLDDDYLDWDIQSAIPTKYWSLSYSVCGVSGGCSEVWLGLDVRED
ncbi:hypothetical protein [Thermococcus sp.]|uniref:hypothetical protein n=1 Tax=Thermococcus sp. TaxID=35749 RepID=UPI00260C137F|nr:hypothetical protein [Thermococcus sp.]